MPRVVFLGTGGGRFATITQTRRTGGLYILDGMRFHIDPGPGALVAMHHYGLDPFKTDALLISHAHTDHYTDAGVLIEAMHNSKHPGKRFLLGSPSVLRGVKDHPPAVSAHYRRKLDRVQVAVPNRTYNLGPSAVSATPTKHSDPTCVGFRVPTTGGVVSYTSDTALTPKMVRSHNGARLLVISATRPLGARIPYHLCTEDAAHLVATAKPQLAVLTHLGMRFLREDPAVQADWIHKKTGIRTIAATDGMTLDLGEEIKVNHL